jgi:hypothetical protein
MKEAAMNEQNTKEGKDLNGDENEDAAKDTARECELEDSATPATSSAATSQPASKTSAEQAPKDKAAVERAPKNKRRWPKRVAVGFVALIAVFAIGFGAYVNDYYHAAGTVAQEAESWQAANQAAQFTTTETNSYIAVGENASEYGIVLYPGAKVEAAAYVPLACELANQGIYCVIAKMPFNLAFFGAGAAEEIVNASPEVKHWWIGGHSLGGVVASMEAAESPSKYEGVALLAAYTTSNLTDTSLKGLVIYGSNDKVRNVENFQKNTGNLPNNTQVITIEGGNHGNFGDYGAQEGDGEATITGQDQQRQTAEAIATAMRE